MDFHHAQQSSDVLSFLHQQQFNRHSCDVILQCSGSSSSTSPSQSLEPTVPAHRCVLSANSSYFRALFDSGLRDSKVHVLHVPVASIACLQRVVHFMYTGDVTISWEDVEQTLGLADFFGAMRIVNYCGEFLRRNITDDTCLKIKTLVGTYNFTDVNDDVTSYMASRWSRLILRDEIAELPREILVDLLRADGCTGFAREEDVLDAVCRWARHQVGSPGGRHQMNSLSIVEERGDDYSDTVLSAFDLLEYVEFRYLSKNVLMSKVIGCPDVTHWLAIRQPEILRNIEDALGIGIPRDGFRDVCEVVFVRSRIASVEDRVRILLYVIESDEWRVWNTLPSALDHGSACLHGLESMTVHCGWMYFICTVVEDMHGYLHKAREWKRLHRVNLETGAREDLTSPPGVLGLCRLVGSIESLLVIDRNGIIDEYVAEDGRWKRTLCATGFPHASAYATLCILPMPIDRKMYLLRTVSSGHSFEYAEKSYVLYHCDTSDESPTWSVISEVEMNEIFLGISQTIADDPTFYGYSISPGIITLTDEFGHARAVYDLSTGLWTARETKVTRPPYLRTADVYGSAVSGERVYCVARNQQESGVEPHKCNTFWMFDNLRRRFKMTTQPPLCPSGLLCHVTLARATIQEITEPSGADRS